MNAGRRRDVGRRATSRGTEKRPSSPQLVLGLDAPARPLSAPSTFAPVPAPALWSPDGALLLPDRVRLISLWQPYCGLVSARAKRLETRGRPFPYPPSWLLLYATKTPNEEAFARLGAVAAPHREPRGVILCLVWIGGSRPMRPEDAGAACYPFEPGRWVWTVEEVHPLARPIPLARGPQNFASHPREAVAAALDRPAALPPP